MIAFIESLRPKQWTKNFVVFAALFFVPGALLSGELVVRSIATFLIFSLAAGAGYLVNDLKDREYDQSHPRKKNRPIPSGRLSPGSAMLGVAILVLIVLIGGVWLDLTDVTLPEQATRLDETWTALIQFPFLFTIIGYLLITFIYSSFFRNVALLDVLLLSVGFTLRAVAGAVALKVIISPWLLLCTGLLALYLALGKRRQEIVRINNIQAGDLNESSPVRKALKGYTVPLLDQLLIISASVNVMSYSLYTFSAAGHPDNRLMITIPFVIYGIFRYHSLIHHQNEGEAPDEVLLQDRPLLICIMLWAVFVTVLMLSPKFLPPPGA